MSQTNAKEQWLGGNHDLNRDSRDDYAIWIYKDVHKQKSPTGGRRVRFNMGIQGLLPLLSPIHTPIHLRDFKGQAVAGIEIMNSLQKVDTYVWLHRGAFSCSLELALGQPTKKYFNSLFSNDQRHINYCMKKVRQLQEHGIWPIMVFDGGYLPMKACTESERRRFNLLVWDPSNIPGDAKVIVKKVSPISRPEPEIKQSNAFKLV